MTYQQITYEERYTLGLLRRQGLSLAAIARALGRHRSTILREVRRNRSNSDGTYRPQLADWYACGRRSHSRRNRRFLNADFRLVRRLIAQQWSPEQVAGYLRCQRTLRISHETIYRYIWDDRLRHSPSRVGKADLPERQHFVRRGARFQRLERGKRHETP